MICLNMDPAFADETVTVLKTEWAYGYAVSTAASLQER